MHSYIDKKRFLLYIFLLTLPIISLFMSECVHEVFIYDFSPAGTIANYILFMLIYALGVMIFGSIRSSVLVMTPVIYLISVASETILQLRGTPVMPADMLSIATAINVASEYSFSFSKGMAAGLAVLIAIMVAAWFLPSKKRSIKYKVIIRLSALILITAIAVPFYTTDFAANHWVKPDFWDQARGYRNSGTILNFVLNTKYLIVEKPESYSASDVPELMQKLTDSESDDGNSGQIPDIIVIMNETWSDLHVLGDFETNEDYMPFTRSLTENTIKGNLYVPVVGAGTSNSEFEFLTGNSMAFLMGGSNAYELYVKNRLPSLVYTLSSQGYSRTGLHPYYANSWKRSTVYPLLGFESFISLENIIGTDLVNKQRNGGLEFTEFRNAVEDMYPNDNVLLRRFVSDSFDFKYLEKLYRERDRNVPFFLFNVTMQNHGGYEAGYTNFDQQIRITSSDTFYPQANRYLSLMRESDRAFEELVDYFSNVSKPTLILMFGDHQPNIEDEFIEEIMGSSLKNLSLEEKQKRYITPFVLWANYDIEENYIDMISSNYLSTLLLQTAGLETTAYNDYLSALYKYIPVIDTVGYITADGSYYSYDDQTEYTDMLNDYEKIQYNNLFDSSERHDELFYIQ
jgi:phosphoglycerol transferase MdoB-like AlkP superfamily enzyme